MTIEEMKKRKIELGYSNEQLAELSGVPLGTVQKVFAGITKAPRYDTVQKLEKVLTPRATYSLDVEPISEVAEAVQIYIAGNGTLPSGRKESKMSIKPIRVKLGMFDGKYKVPPEELFYNDDIAEMFEDL